MLSLHFSPSEPSGAFGRASEARYSSRFLFAQVFLLGGSLDRPCGRSGSGNKTEVHKVLFSTGGKPAERKEGQSSLELGAFESRTKLVDDNW
jgi:hypothetical protein